MKLTKLLISLTAIFIILSNLSAKTQKSELLEIYNSKKYSLFKTYTVKRSWNIHKFFDEIMKKNYTLWGADGLIEQTKTLNPKLAKHFANLDSGTVLKIPHIPNKENDKFVMLIVRPGEENPLHQLKRNIVIRKNTDKLVIKKGEILSKVFSHKIKDFFDWEHRAKLKQEIKKQNPHVGNLKKLPLGTKIYLSVIPKSIEQTDAVILNMSSKLNTYAESQIEEVETVKAAMIQKLEEVKAVKATMLTKLEEAESIKINLEKKLKVAALDKFELDKKLKEVEEKETIAEKEQQEAKTLKAELMKQLEDVKAMKADLSTAQKNLESSKATPILKLTEVENIKSVMEKKLQEAVNIKVALEKQVLEAETIKVSLEKKLEEATKAKQEAENKRIEAEVAKKIALNKQDEAENVKKTLEIQLKEVAEAKIAIEKKHKKLIAEQNIAKNKQKVAEQLKNTVSKERVATSVVKEALTKKWSDLDATNILLVKKQEELEELQAELLSKLTDARAEKNLALKMQKEAASIKADALKQQETALNEQKLAKQEQEKAKKAQKQARKKYEESERQMLVAMSKQQEFEFETGAAILKQSEAEKERKTALKNQQEAEKTKKVLGDLITEMKQTKSINVNMMKRLRKVKTASTKSINKQTASVNRRLAMLKESKQFDYGKEKKRKSFRKTTLEDRKNILRDVYRTKDYLMFRKYTVKNKKTWSLYKFLLQTRKASYGIWKNVGLIAQTEKLNPSYFRKFDKLKKGTTLKIPYVPTKKNDQFLIVIVRPGESDPLEYTMNRISKYKRTEQYKVKRTQTLSRMLLNKTESFFKLKGKYGLLKEARRQNPHIRNFSRLPKGTKVYVIIYPH